MTGIYAIKNKINNKMYVGSALNIERRWKRHKTELKNLKHANKYLEKSFVKYGSDSFEFLILEFCTKEKIIEREIYYLNKFNSLDRSFGYNLSIPVIHPSVKSSSEYSSILSKVKKGITPTNFKEMQKERWKEVEVYIDGVLSHTFPSLRETERSLNIPRGNVYNYLKGKTKKLKNLKNYEFRYKK